MIYLDHAASSPPLGSVRRCLPELLDRFANPGAAHPPGEDARRRIEDCRRALADHYRLLRRQIVFTASGTLANNIVIASCRQAAGRVLSSPLEHASVREALVATGQSLTEIPLVAGRLDLDFLERELTAAPVTLVSVMAVHNETGLILPLEEIGARIRRLAPAAIYHVDGVQAFLRRDPELKRCGIDYYTVSGHKVGALKGVGAIICGGDPERLRPLWRGGGQEQGLVSGTENTLAIESLALALAWWQKENPSYLSRLSTMRAALAERLAAMSGVKLLELPDVCQWILPLILPGCEAPSTVVRMLGEAGYAVSSGSACRTGRAEENPGLVALGLPPSWRRGLLRVSFGPDTTEEDLEAFPEALNRVLTRLKGNAR